MCFISALLEMWLVMKIDSVVPVKNLPQKFHVSMLRACRNTTSNHDEINWAKGVEAWRTFDFRIFCVFCEFATDCGQL